MFDAVAESVLDFDFTPLARADVNVLPIFLTFDEEPLNADTNPLMLVSASVSTACTKVLIPVAFTESVVTEDFGKFITFRLT